MTTTRVTHSSAWALCSLVLACTHEDAKVSETPGPDLGGARAGGAAGSESSSTPDLESGGAGGATAVSAGTAGSAVTDGGAAGATDPGGTAGASAGMRSLPDCEPYSEPEPWIAWSDLDSHREFVDEADPDSGFLSATVSWDGDVFTIEKGTYAVSGVWNYPGPPPMTDGQSVEVRLVISAADDGCCDEASIVVWDESYNLLVAYASNSELFNHRTLEQTGSWYEFPDRSDLVETEMRTEAVCSYADGERPPVLDRATSVQSVSGRSLEFRYGDSRVRIDRPASSATTEDGKFAVHWPVGWEAVLGSDPTAKPSSWSTVLEVVAVVDEG
jgi:hypothetical protein